MTCMKLNSDLEPGIPAVSKRLTPLVEYLPTLSKKKMPGVWPRQGLLAAAVTSPGVLSIRPNCLLEIPKIFRVERKRFFHPGEKLAVSLVDLDGSRSW